MENTNGYFSKSVRSADMMFIWSKALINVHNMLDQNDLDPFLKVTWFIIGIFKINLYQAKSLDTNFIP